jgi:dienelactone hydrolase
MRSPRWFALALALAPAAKAQSLAEQLAQAVDRPTPVERARSAAALAQQHASQLRELLAAMRAFGTFEALPAGASTTRERLPVGREVEETELALYVPKGYDPAKPAPLLLAFHGTGGSGGDVLSMWRKIADDGGVLVLAPSEAGKNEGYRFSERERLAALAALRWIRRRANVDEECVFATGVSRGGHLAWDLALRFPDLFAGIAPMIGGPRITIQDRQNNLRYVENVARLPIRDLQGAQDDPALVWSVEFAFERLKKLGASDAQLSLQPEHGHSFDLNAVDWRAFFASTRRVTRPERVVRASAREGEGRSHWLEVLAYSPSVEEEFTPKITQLGWAQKSEDEKRRLLIRLADERTSRLEAQRTARGRFSATSERVKSWRLLLCEDDFDAKEDVQVSWNGSTVRKRLRASPQVLLAEFVERFDRTFLPVAELELR